MRALETRLTRLERQSPKYSEPAADAGKALEAIKAIVEDEGGRIPGESWATATARIMGITDQELFSRLRERANA